MKRGFYLIFILALTTATHFGQASPPSETSTSHSRLVTVAFWNIEWFPGTRPSATTAEQNRQIKSVHADIAQLNPDILGMEEVRDFTQAGVAIAPLSGFKVDVCANFPPREGQNEAQEVAIASRLQPMSASAEQWKTAGAMTPPRGFVFAAYEIAPRQLLFVYGVHLKSNRGDLLENIAMRQESIRQLRGHIDAMQQVYGKLGTITSVVGGDFNTSLDDHRFAQETTLRSLIDNGFTWTFRDLPPPSGVTLPASKGFPPASFDHVFYRGATLLKTWVGETSPQSSDHRPVIATFELPLPEN